MRCNAPSPPSKSTTAMLWTCSLFIPYLCSFFPTIHLKINDGYVPEYVLNNSSSVTDAILFAGTMFFAGAILSHLTKGTGFKQEQLCV